jgi:hypothetical protein
MSKANRDGTASEETENTGQEEKSPGKVESVKRAIELFELKLAGGEMKPTVGEYVRLLELQKELDGDEIKEIRVKWVEPVETESSNKT